MKFWSRRWIRVIWAEESIEHTFITGKCTPKPAQGFVEKCSPIWERISCLDPNFVLPFGRILPFGRNSPKLSLRPYCKIKIKMIVMTCLLLSVVSLILCTPTISTSTSELVLHVLPCACVSRVTLTTVKKITVDMSLLLQISPFLYVIMCYQKSKPISEYLNISISNSNILLFGNKLEFNITTEMRKKIFW